MERLDLAREEFCILDDWRLYISSTLLKTSYRVGLGLSVIKCWHRSIADAVLQLLLLLLSLAHHIYYHYYHCFFLAIPVDLAIIDIYLDHVKNVDDDDDEITGSAVALHCCKAHAIINTKIENSTPCKIVTHGNFDWHTWLRRRHHPPCNFRAESAQRGLPPK